MSRIKFITLILANIFIVASSFATNRYFTQKSLSELVPGKQNEDVRLLQQSLYDFGYYKSDEDEPEFSGKFGNDLFLAIKDFQQTNELRATGRADFETLKTLNEFIKFQSDSEEKDEMVPNKIEKDTGYNVDQKDYFKDEKEQAYFDGDEQEDVADMYASGSSVDGQNEFSENNRDNEKRVEGEGENESIVGKIFNSIKNFFMPSERYREKARQILEVNLPNKSRFENYTYFDCIEDDDCLEYMKNKDTKAGS